MPCVALWMLACASSSDDGQTNTHTGSGASGGTGMTATSAAQGGSSSSANQASSASATTGNDDTGSSSATSQGTDAGGTTASGGAADTGGTTGTAGASTSAGGTTDAGSGGTAGAASCDDIRSAVQQELVRVASCEADDHCEYSFIGTGCTDSPLPCCGFPNRVGADLSALAELDDSYREQSCAGAGLACCACPMPPPLGCIEGVCTPQ